MVKADDGGSGPATAEIIRYGPAARIGKALLWAAAGFVGGAACILVPVVHLITTWALPLAGIVLCVKTLRTHERVVTASGKCPGCGEQVGFAGGSLDAARSCPGCGVGLKLFPANGPDEGAGIG